MEPGLALTFSDIQSEVGHFLGYGTTASSWTAAKTSIVQQILDAGCRAAYYPMAIPGEAPHSWSFLRPTLTLTTAEDVFEYDLPVGVSIVENPITFAANIPYGDIRIIGEHSIRKLRSDSASSGVPSLCAVVPAQPSNATIQRYQMLFWRTPSDAWVLSYRCAVVPQPLGTNNPYPVGPVSFHECIKESCYSKAEERLNDTQGVHKAAFMERLQVALAEDRKIESSASLGYNGDPGMNRAMSRNDWRSGLISTTINGDLPVSS